jgi:hypothetical protein
MTQSQKDSRTPADRFRSIISEERDQEAPSERRTPAVVNLPPVGDTGGSGGKAGSPRSRIPAPEQSAWRRGLAMFWTVACVLSLALNALILLLVLPVLRDLRSLDSSAADGGLLVGMYNSFAQMDDAHITAAVPVKTEIPLDVTLPVHTTSGLTLAQDATIEGAHVRINTALFNIDAPASVTLPAGTKLNVAVDLELPMQTTVPVDLNVPIDIPLRETGLHDAISSMQDAIRPLVCSSRPAARTATGEPICH